MYRYLYYVTILGIILMITDNIRENWIKTMIYHFKIY